MTESSLEKQKKPWYFWVDEKRRRNLLKILEELGRLQNKVDPEFILIGAMSLLIRGMLHYTVQWDIDLLFRNEDTLSLFIAEKKSKDLRIVHYDNEIMRGKDISSIHTAWSFDKTWFNLDYILKPKSFEFYYSTLSREGPYQQCVDYEGKVYKINLFIAHPWDVFIEKLLSPRFQYELEKRDSMSVDIRHAIAIFEREKSNEKFWQMVGAKVRKLRKKRTFKKNLLELLHSLSELGYISVEVPDYVYGRIRNF